MTSTDVPLGLFAGDPLSVSERCVNTAFAGAGCTRCVDICPAGAIRAGDGPAVIDQSACTRCGACLPACPTEAIASRSPSRQLYFSIADLPRGEGVVVSCPRATTQDASVHVVRHDRCLAALGVEELLDLAGDTSHELWLDDSACATCDLGPLRPVIDLAVRNANSLLRGIGCEAIVHLAPPPERTSKSGTPAVLVDSRNTSMSRRGLFRRLIRETERVAVEAGGSSLPRRRQRLVDRLRRARPHPSSDGVPPVAVPGFGEIVVDADRCSACGLCAKFCPTGALAFHITAPDIEGRETFDLSAQAARCVDCGVCAAACPDSALSVESSADLSALLTGSSKTIAAGILVRCEVCGTPVAGFPGLSKRCFGCRGGVVSPLRDEVGLMADLLGRVPPTA